MEERRRFVAETTELGKIDFLLDQLARAVERGEVHRRSYDLMAPRYLERRAELIAIVTGENRQAASGSHIAGAAGKAAASTGTAEPPSIAASNAARPHAAPHSGRAAVSGSVPAATANAAPIAVVLPSSVAVAQAPVAAPFAATSSAGAAPQRPQVAWTTVLLFLGSFLVIVASAIFAVAVWDLLGVTGKLVFMGSLTVAFYGAGFWARRRLETPVGSVALTGVASALLLFDGWIAIDGYNLQGPLPWAALLLVCSAVYWFTEVALAGQFFGAIGAAAQLGWWWLLGEGMGLPVPVRLAGMAVVALAWQFAALRAERSPQLQSLARVLEYAAPITSVLLAIALLGDFALLQSAGTTDVFAAAVVACAAGVTLGRSRLLGESSYSVAAIAQLPLAMAVTLAISTTGHSWAVAGVLLAAAVVYGSVAIFAAGAPFAALALATELGAVLEIGVLLEWRSGTLAVAAAVLACTWAIACRLARNIAEQPSTPRGVADTAVVAEIGSVLGLGAASLVLLADLAARPSALVAADVAAAGVVLAAWLVAAFATRRGVFLALSVAWTWAAVGSVGMFAFGPDRPAFTFGLIAMASAAWLAVPPLVDTRFDAVSRDAVRWIARAGMLGATLVGCASDVLRVLGDGTADVWGTTAAAALAGVGAVLFAVDAATARCEPSAAAAGGLAVLGGALAGGSVPDRYPEQFALAGASTAAVLAAAGTGLRLLVKRYAGYLAVGATAVASVALWAAVADPGLFFAATAVLAVAWVFAAIAGSRPFAFAAAMSTVLAVLAAMRWMNAPAIATVVSVGSLCLGLVSYSLVDNDEDAERFAVLPAALSVAGLLGLLGLLFLGVVAGAGGGGREWWEITDHAFAMTLAFLGTALLVLASRYRVQPAVYVGWAVLLLALWSEMGQWKLDSAELFSTSLAVYLIAMGHIAHRNRPDGPYPMALDAAAVLIGLGVPLRLSLVSFPVSEAVIHLAWVVALSLIAIGAGIFGKVRWYLFGGVAALSGVALYRSFALLAEVWWLVLFVVGVALLVIALTWERQRVVVSSTRERLKRSFEEWR